MKEHLTYDSWEGILIKVGGCLASIGSSRRLKICEPMLLIHFEGASAWDTRWSKVKVGPGDTHVTPMWAEAESLVLQGRHLLSSGAAKQPQREDFEPDDSAAWC